MWISRKEHQHLVDGIANQKSRADYWQDRARICAKERDEADQRVTFLKDEVDTLIGDCDRIEAYSVELRKALDASEQRHTDLADKHNALLAKQPVRGAGGRFVGKVQA